MWTKEQMDLIKKTVAQGTTEDEFRMFLHYCEKSGLDPLRKQAHCIVREWTKKDGKTHRDVNMMTGIDGFRARAELMPDYLGCQSAAVYDSDEFSIDYGSASVQHVVKFPRPNDSKIIGAWCIVNRQHRSPYIHWMPWQELFDGRSPTHQKMPEIMAKKTSEAQALRHEYPEPFSGIYDLAEIPTTEGDEILTSGGHTLPETPTPILTEVGKAAPVAAAKAIKGKAEVKKPPSDKQIERINELVGWGMSHRYAPQDADVDIWVSDPARTAAEVGEKIRVWKARKVRHDTCATLEDEMLKRYADDKFVVQDIQLARYQWVMYGESDFAEYCNNIEANNTD
jgi:phage recombination protein Bet